MGAQCVFDLAKGLPSLARPGRAGNPSLQVCAGPYTVGGGSYFAIGTFTPVFFAKSFASL